MLLEIILGMVLLVAFIAEVVLTETEHFGWATALLLICGGVCYYFNIYGAAMWVKAHVAQTLIFVGVYLVAGVVWSFVKWFSYLVSYRDKWREAKEKDEQNKKKWISDAKERLTASWAQYNEELNDWRKNRRAMAPDKPRSEIPENDKAWDDYYTKNYWSYPLRARNFSKPLASDNKAKITAWMAFWPFSFLGTFINDPIRRLCNFIFSSFKRLYQQMADHMFKDLAPKEEE